MANKIDRFKEAIRNGDLDTVKAILDDRGIVSWFTGTVAPEDGIAEASSHGQVEVCRYLLSVGADPNLGLHDAVRAGSLPTVTALLESGADLQTKDDKQNNVLSVAYGAYKLEMLVHLAGIAPELLKDPHNNPLLSASLNWREDYIEALLRCGANPNLVSEWGGTALHSAMHAAHMSVYEVENNILKKISIMLLLAGAQADAKNKNGETPRDVLRESMEKSNSLRAGSVKMLQGLKSFPGLDVDAAIGSLTDQGDYERIMRHLLQVDEMLEAFAVGIPIETLVSNAVSSGIDEIVPFALLPQLVLGVIEKFQELHEDASTSHVIDVVLGRFTFNCKECGDLSSDLVNMAIAARLAVDRNPDSVVAFSGRNVQQTFQGWCPGCGTTTAKARFSPGEAKELAEN